MFYVIRNIDDNVINSILLCYDFRVIEILLINKDCIAFSFVGSCNNLAVLLGFLRTQFDIVIILLAASTKQYGESQN